MITQQEKVLQLLDEHGEALHRLLARLTRCEHTTKDLLQELFMKLLKSEGFLNTETPYAYAWKAATNLAFSWHRKNTPKKELAEPENLVDNTTPKTIDKMISEEQLKQILSAISTLNPMAREVIVMRFIEQRPYEEIAQKLDKKPQYLRALCSKSLKKLRNTVNRQISAPLGQEVLHD